MKSLQEYIKEALNESAFEGDIIQLKKDFVIYTTGDDALFSDGDKEDVWNDLFQFLSHDSEIIIPKGSFIQFCGHDRYYRSINVYTKKVNFTGLVIGYDGEEEVLHISKEATNDELNAFTDKYKAKTIEANML